MILITGASGFVGKNLVPEIIKKQKIRILVRRTSNIELFRDKNEIEIVYGDLENDIGIKEALNGIDMVIHSAARTIGNKFDEYYRTNTQGTANLVRAIEQKNIKGIIHLSSHAACGPCREKTPFRETDQPQPISFYGATKKLAEDIVKKSGIPYIILRPVSVYGPYDMDILKYINLLNKGICPIVGFGEKYVNFIYVKDLVDLIIRVAETGKFDNQTYFVSDGQCYSYTEVLNEIATILNKKNIKIHVPKSIALFVGLMNDVFLHEKKRLVWRDKIRELAAEYWLCTSERSVKTFGFEPKYSIKTGMQETINWYKTHDFLK